MSKSICEMCSHKSLPDYWCVEGSLLRTSTDGLHTESCSDSMPLTQYDRLMAGMTVKKMAGLLYFSQSFQDDWGEIDFYAMSEDEGLSLVEKWLNSEVSDG